MLALRRMRVFMTWAWVGLGIGLFWLFMAWLFFTGKGLFVEVLFDYVAVATYPPLFFVDEYSAPLWNALLYGLVGLAVRKMRL